MTHIKQVHIKEFRGLRDCAATLGKYNQPPHVLNVFVGDNASGKTSFIEAIIEAMRKPTSENIYVQWTWIPEARQTVYFSCDRRQDRVDGVQIMSVQSSKTDSERGRIAKFVSKTVQSQSRRAVGRYAGTAKDVQWLNALNMFWTQFRNNGTTFDTDFVSPEDFDNPDWNLFLFKGEERICSVDDMSSGEIDAIAFAVPFITMPAPFDGVVLIDDVEASMTQEWATSLLTALRAMLPEAQFIVTTRLTGWTIPDCAMYDMGAITGKA